MQSSQKFILAEMDILAGRPLQEGLAEARLKVKCEIEACPKDHLDLIRMGFLAKYGQSSFGGNSVRFDPVLCLNPIAADEVELRAW